MGYKARDRVLATMGFASYSAYLESDLWKRIRSKILSESKNCCKSCRGMANQVHHVSYARDVLEGRDLQKLVPICENCHRGIEFNQDGTKRTHKQANEDLFKRLQMPFRSSRPHKKQRKFNPGKKIRFVCVACFKRELAHRNKPPTCCGKVMETAQKAAKKLGSLPPIGVTVRDPKCPGKKSKKRRHGHEEAERRRRKSLHGMRIKGGLQAPPDRTKTTKHPELDIANHIERIRERLIAKRSIAQPQETT